jgi:hypothetical protein
MTPMVATVECFSDLNANFFSVVTGTNSNLQNRSNWQSVHADELVQERNEIMSLRLGFR